MRNLKPKKYLGQHFLTDLGVAEKIVGFSRAQSQDQLIEIGPGQGVLTELMIDRFSQLHVVEVDADAVHYIKNYFGERLRIIHEDVLKWKMEEDIQEDAFFIGNLPYNISSPFFFKLLENLPLVKEGVFMIQKEVADRICAPSGNKQYGILSILLGAYFERENLLAVPPDVFRPPPKVMSGVIRLSRKEELPNVNFSQFKAVVKTAFNQRRKTLRNALKSISFQDFEGKEALFQKRAEQLEIEDFLFLVGKVKV